MACVNTFGPVCLLPIATGGKSFVRLPGPLRFSGFGGGARVKTCEQRKAATSNKEGQLHRTNSERCLEDRNPPIPAGASKKQYYPHPDTVYYLASRE